MSLCAYVFPFFSLSHSLSLSLSLAVCAGGGAGASIANQCKYGRNLLVCANSKRVKLIDFGAAAAVGTDERVGFDAERGPCDEKYHAPEQLIDERHWEVVSLFFLLFFPCD